MNSIVSALNAFDEPSGSVLAVTVFDDGSGPAFYAAGSFTIAGGVAANRVAKWDFSAFSRY
jgi:hypothetical protein